MNIRNNISYSCKKAVPKPCPQRSFPGRQVHYAFSQCLSVNSSINVQYIVSQESLLKSWLHISSLNLSEAVLGCFAVYRDGEEIIYYLIWAIIYYLPYPETAYVTWPVSYCWNRTYALCVMRWLSSVQPPFVLACSR